MNRRGRVYECRRCPFKGAKHASIWHVIKDHAPLEAVPHYCSLCKFRAQRDVWLKHHMDKCKRQQRMLAARPDITDASSFTCMCYSQVMFILFLPFVGMFYKHCKCIRMSSLLYILLIEYILLYKY